MEKKRIKFLSIIFALSMLLAGCGVTPLHEMTDEEREYIIHSAAHLVAKHNIKQTDGINDYIPSEEELTDEADKEEVSDDPMANINLDEPGIDGMISFSEAIGQPKVDITYDGMYMDDTYQEGQYYLLAANEGCKYAILKFTLRNPYVDSMEVDAFGAGPVFYANFGDGNYVKQESTFLTYSLPTYQGVVKPGETINLVLVFQLDESVPSSNQLQTMQVEVSGKKYYVNL